MKYFLLLPRTRFTVIIIDRLLLQTGVHFLWRSVIEKQAKQLWTICVMVTKSWPLCPNLTMALNTIDRVVKPEQQKSLWIMQSVPLEPKITVRVDYKYKDLHCL